MASSAEAPDANRLQPTRQAGTPKRQVPIKSGVIAIRDDILTCRILLSPLQEERVRFVLFKSWTCVRGGEAAPDTSRERSDTLQHDKRPSTHGGARPGPARSSPAWRKERPDRSLPPPRQEWRIRAARPPAPWAG